MTSPNICQGWLIKSSQPAKRIFQPGWRRRWFVLRGSGALPHQFLLEYFTDEGCKRRKGHINLNECAEVPTPLVIQDRQKFTFNIQTRNRSYCLAAETEVEMNKWIEYLCSVCGLKSSEDANETEMYAIDENNRPFERGGGGGEESNNANNEISPTLSTNHVSVGYIPISECITGKPIFFDKPNNPQESTYCNITSFPFPPKVNWTTYPSTNANGKSVAIDMSSKTGGGTVRSAIPPNPPPRPPKSLSSKSSAFSDNSDLTSPVDFSLNSPSADVLHESSSPSSSVNSPGATYSNLSDLDPKSTGPIYMNPPCHPNGPNSQAAHNSRSRVGKNSGSPPRVDRHLKPDSKKSSSEISFQTNPNTCKYSGGAMTLPSRNLFNRQSTASGPAIDRSRKPEAQHQTVLTPVHMRGHSADQFFRVSSTTLPSNHRRTPLISPSDKKPQILRECDQASDLIGTYLEIETRVGDSKIRIHNSAAKASKAAQPKIKDDGGVEYRMIDPVRTKALNLMRLEREEQLRSVPTRSLSKSLH